ncbi:MAG TPA: hypothetical protein VFL49_06140 [Pseudolabrys sp.]|jgi:hypothetical protein|nr:hypothetical protein [Pseudolabrys sp.]
MRRMIVSCVAIAITSLAGIFVAATAEAMTTSVPLAMAGILESGNSIQKAEYVCRRVRRCGPYGCGWRRQCWEAGPGYYGGGYGYYAPRRGYYGRGGAYPCGPGWSLQDGVCKPYRGY